MRVMVLVKATKDSEAGVMPSTELLAAMGLGGLIAGLTVAVLSGILTRTTSLAAR